jgi:hypothetical protein
MGKVEEKSALGRCKYRWNDDTEMGFREVGLDRMG